MKTKLFYTITAVLLTLTSCSDSLLNTKPLDKFSENDIWEDVQLADGFVATTYNEVTHMLTGYEEWSDNMISNSGSDVMREQFDKYRSDGWDEFGKVRRCNLIIEKVEASDFYELAKKTMIGEAKMLRAIIHFKQARFFGKLMIVDKVLTDKDDFNMSRTATIKDTYDFILKDLEDAANDLPTKAALGRLTKGAALALAAEVALHGASYIESGKEEYYQKVITASEELFKLDYQLDTDYRALFNDNAHARQSKEIILARWRLEDNTTSNDTPMQRRFPNASNGVLFPNAPRLSGDFGGWASEFPSQSLADSYLVVDTDGKVKKWDETSYYNNFKVKGGSVYDAIYKNRDSRFYASLVHDSCMYLNSMIYIRDGDGGNLHWYSNQFEPGVWCNTKTGYYFRKGIYDNAQPFWDYHTPYHFMLLRLGRSCLNYAEVMLRTGNISKAIEYINKTRDAHGNLPALPTGLSNEEAWKYYKLERRVELFDECDRYWSLVRWAKADGQKTVPELTEEFTAINIAADGKSFEIIPLPFNRNENSNKVFTERRFLFPVPEGQRLLNPNLDQNPGW